MANRGEELIISKFSKKFEEYNTNTLKKIAETIKEFKNLSYSDAHKLAQQLKYDKSYTDLLDDLTKLTNQSKKEIKGMLEEEAKQNIEFADTYYKAKNLNAPIFEESNVLKDIVNANKNITGEEFSNIARSTGFTFLDKNNHITFLNMKDTYHKVIDESVYALSQGKDTFDNLMRNTINQLAESGVKRIVYSNDGKRQYTQRLDTAIRRNILDSIRQVSNETQIELGKQIDADGVEISVHDNPAPDHSEIQGRQFSYKEYRKLQEGKRAKDYKGNYYQIKHSKKGGYRQISQYNCYHKIFSINLGVDEPMYSDEQLQEIQDINNQKVMIDGKEYTKYEATQLQRQLETEIRKAKDKHIMFKETDDKLGMLKEQKRITQLTKKYKEISKKANIDEDLKRARVSGYRRVSVKNLKEANTDKVNIKKNNIKANEIKINNKEDLLNKWNEIYKDDNIEVKHILKADPKLLDTQITQVDTLLNKYSFVKDGINSNSETNKLIIQTNTPDMMGEKNVARFFANHYIEFNEKCFNDKYLLYDLTKTKIDQGWWQEVNAKNYRIYPITHEFGHLLEFKMIEKISKKADMKGFLENKYYYLGDDMIRKEIFKKVPDWEDYLSLYGKSRVNFEWFAETFAQMELGKQTPLTNALKEYIDEFMGGKYVFDR